MASSLHGKKTRSRRAVAKEVNAFVLKEEEGLKDFPVKEGSVMKRASVRISLYLVSVLPLIALFFCDAIFAGSQRAGPARPDEIIAEFVASVEISGRLYSFDHNGDGLADMTVYPLRTRNPDLETEYITLEEAVKDGRVILRENPRNYGPDRSRGNRTVLAADLSTRPVYFQIGTGLRGGGQARGFGGGGVMQGAGRGGGFSSVSTPAGALGVWFQLPGAPVGAPPELEVDVLCFEKGRLIHESMESGTSEYFTYAGLASPSVRKKLIYSSSQPSVDKIIAKELKRYGVSSKTRALTDIFENQDVLRTVRYYAVNSRKVLDENENVSGMIIASRDGSILCADMYASPDLFERMFTGLIKSAALEMCKKGRKTRSRGADVEKFLRDVRGARRWKRKSSQAYSHISSRLISEAVLYSARNGAKFVHLEAYPRSPKHYILK